MDAYYAYLPAWQVFAATHKACNGVSDSRPPPLPSSLPDALRFSLAAAAIIRAFPSAIMHEMDGVSRILFATGVRKKGTPHK